MKKHSLQLNKSTGKKVAAADVSNKVAAINQVSGESKSFGTNAGEKKTAAQRIYGRKLGLKGKPE